MKGKGTHHCSNFHGERVIFCEVCMSEILKKGSIFGLYILVFFKKGVSLHRLISIDNWKMQKKSKNMYSTNMSLFIRRIPFIFRVSIL